MIINKLASPEKSLYVIGAKILQVLHGNENLDLDVIQLYKKFNDEDSDISLSYFSYGLDWLYLIGLIEVTDSGNIIVCN